MHISKEKHVWVLSGGGAAGAYQVGMCRELIDAGIYPTTLIGVSTGALQAACLAQGIGVEGLRKQMDLLEDIWLNQIRSNDDICKRRKIWTLLPPWKRKGLYDNKPLKRLIEKNVDPDKVADCDRKLIVGTVDLCSGNYVAASSLNSGNIREWILASTSIPASFDPVIIDGYLLVDGGVRNVTPLTDAVKETYATHVWILLASPPKPRSKKKKQFGNILEIALRAIGLQTNETFQTDLALGLKNLSVPSTILQVKSRNIGTLEFEPQKIREAYEHGREVARIKLKR